MNSMQDLTLVFGVVVIISIVILKTIAEENRLKFISGAWIIALVLTAPMLSELWASQAISYVDDDGNSHDGLPQKWNETQVICFDFSSDSNHPVFMSGTTMISTSGESISVNDAFNGSVASGDGSFVGDEAMTGVCIGGLSGYTNGFDLTLDAVAFLPNRDLEVVYDVGDYGPFVTSIGGVAQADDWSSWWGLYINGAEASVGIGDLQIDADDVITWRIES
jgi:hypothetical protein